MKQAVRIGALFVIRLLIKVLIGLRVHHRQQLPQSGPAIVVANHNSHLDTLVLFSLFPLATAVHLRPIANQQYFLQQNRWLAWVSRHVFNIIPVATSSLSCQPENHHYRYFFQSCAEALAQNQILILYPEGTRGEPNHLGEFKMGIAHLAKRHPTVPIVPIFLQGLGKALPKGEMLLVPFLCGVCIGEPLYWKGHKQAFLQQLLEQMQQLSTQVQLV